MTVIERHDAAARGTSYSNAGLVSPGDATAWASPAALRTFLRALYDKDLGIKVRLRFDPYFLLWTMRFLGQCTTAQSQLIGYLGDRDAYDPADLERFSGQVDELCQAATDANAELQQELAG